MKKLILGLSIILLLSATFADSTSTTTHCPQECNCEVESSDEYKQVARCHRKGLREIPKYLNAETEYLYLFYNEIHNITQHDFKEVGNNLITLVLTHNSIKTLHPDTFKDLLKIRYIYINNNQIEKLENGLFNNLQSLKKVDLDQNRIVHIGLKAFMNVPQLEIIWLSDNKLEYLHIDVFRDLPQLKKLHIYDNPWRCDCRLRPLMVWVLSKPLRITFLKCSDKTWSDRLKDLVCEPTIFYASSSTTVKTSDTDITLSCQANGDPPPEIYWVLDGQIIDSADSKYYITSTTNDTWSSKWVNLTIANFTKIDSGEYVCRANNSKGLAERNLTLEVIMDQKGFTERNLTTFDLIIMNQNIQIIMIVVAILIFIGTVLLFIRHYYNKKKALVENSMTQMEMSPITVNPETDLYMNVPAEMSRLCGNDNDSNFGDEPIYESIDEEDTDR